MELISPETMKLSLSLFNLSNIFPFIVKIFIFSPLSCVLNRCPNSVGVKAVQKPAVFASVSERSDVETSATKGTTHIKTIKPSTK